MKEKKPSVDCVRKINRSDVLWNMAATFFKMAAAVVLLPFVLRYFEPETVGIWTIFMTITNLCCLLDFGFQPTFVRNVSYIFSGVSKLQKQGVSSVSCDEGANYPLLKGSIAAMKGFYGFGALLMLSLLLSAGTPYIHYLLKNYQGNHWEVYIAWFLLCIFSTYNFYTLYYEALLQGQGQIKRLKQIIVLGRLAYLSVAILLLVSGYGIISVVSAQLVSLVIVRVLSHRSFFTPMMKAKLKAVEAEDKMEILRNILPNALKIGGVLVGTVVVNQLLVFVASFFIPLQDMASYGITMQLITVLVTLSKIYIDTYMPTLSQSRTVGDYSTIRRIFQRGSLLLWGMGISGGLVIVFLGNPVLEFLQSKTFLMPPWICGIAILFAMLDAYQVSATNIISTSNCIPFLKSSLITGGAVLLGVVSAFLGNRYGNVAIEDFNLWILVVVPGLVQLAYQDWKWPMEVCKELHRSQDRV